MTATRRRYRRAVNFVAAQIITEASSTMTEAEEKEHNSSNGNAPPEASREDVFDHTYQEKEGPKPPRTIVWRNVVLMTLLHIGAVYSVLLIPSASPLTLLWCEYNLSSSTGCLGLEMFVLPAHTKKITAVMSASSPTLPPPPHSWWMHMK